MALQNAFGDLVTAAQMRQLLNLLQLARDQTDVLRVNVAAGTLDTVQQIRWSAAGANANYYATGSPNSMDARVQQAAAARQVAIQSRNRWTIT